MKQSIEIYTDGSCHPQLSIGAWVAILLVEGKKIILEGKELKTTHNRMELTAVIKALEYIKTNYKGIRNVSIFSDSQYVTTLSAREEKLSGANFITQKGTAISNIDLVKDFLEQLPFFQIQFIKVKAHQKKNDRINYNIEADKRSRKLVREAVIFDTDGFA
jgi:ribonuclease HI